MFFLTLVIRQSKKSEAKLADPTRCPRGLKPVVSSMGLSGKVLLVGCGDVENS
jgi:hypothetical protein